ncbi:MAG: DNA repair protein RecO [Patescibacteria group bacterium]|jgi:DNA repair protein RecO
MSLVDVRGVVLGRKDVREDSRLYTIFTQERGKVEFFGRGIRKGKAKLGGHLEPGAVVRCTVAPGKTGETITAVERSHAPTSAQQSLAHVASLTFLLGVTDAITKPEAPDAPLASFLEEALSALESLPVTLALHARFRMWVAWHIFSAVGVVPDTTHCSHCRKPLVGDARFSKHHGGWVGQECANLDPTAFPVPAQVRDFTHALTRESWAMIADQNITPVIETDAARVTQAELHHVAERAIPVERFVAFTRALG